MSTDSTGSSTIVPFSVIASINQENLLQDKHCTWLKSYFQFVEVSILMHYTDNRWRADYRGETYWEWTKSNTKTNGPGEIQPFKMNRHPSSITNKSIPEQETDFHLKTTTFSANESDIPIQTKNKCRKHPPFRQKRKGKGGQKTITTSRRWGTSGRRGGSRRRPCRRASSWPRPASRRPRWAGRSWRAPSATESPGASGRRPPGGGSTSAGRCGSSARRPARTRRGSLGKTQKSSMSGRRRGLWRFRQMSMSAPAPSLPSWSLPPLDSASYLSTRDALRARRRMGGSDKSWRINLVYYYSY